MLVGKTLESFIKLANSIKIFNNQAHIGVINTTSANRPYVVYRLLEDKSFFNNNETAIAGLHAHYGICGNGSPLAVQGAITVTSTTLSGSAPGYYSNGLLYSWRCSFVFDGIQESELSAEATDTAVTNDDTAAILLSATNAGINFSNTLFDKRITAVKIYRAESSNSFTENLGVYRLVATIDINDSGWAANGNHYDLTYTDTGGYPEGGATYEEETGIPETLGLNTAGVPIGSWVNYELNAVGGSYHWMAKIIIESTLVSSDIDWGRYIFRSQKYRPNMVNWAEGNHLVLPGILVELQYYNNKLYAFTENNLYRIHPELLIVEDAFEGVGISKQGGVVVTESGMFFCNLNGAYRLFNNQITTITDNVKISLGNYTVNWVEFAKDCFTTPAHLGRIIVAYLADKRCVIFMGSAGTATTYAFVYYLPTEEWYTWNFGSAALDTNSGLVTGKDGELYWSGTTTLNKLLGGSGNQDCDWVSKEFTLGKPSQNKLWGKMKWDGDAGTGSIVVKYNTNGGDPLTGTTATSDTYFNIYKKTFQAYFDLGGNATVDSTDILVRELEGER